ncbi:MAG: transporter associated domain-containing protein [Gemmatimonadaceae bacterium]|nr:transporter associated domain-containing protein [Gemmatimonadaceae bacterium]
MTAAVLAGFFVLSAALCAAADGALLTIDLDEVPPNEPVRPMLVDREATHRALAFARILMQLGAGAALAVALGPDANVVLAVVLAAVTVTVSESGARALGDLLAIRALRRLSPVAQAATAVLRPVVAIGAWFDGVLANLMPRRPDADARDANIERFREVVAAEVADGSSADAGQRLLTGVFALGDTQVKEIMVPRVDIVGVERDARWSEVVARVRSSRHSRLVVYGEDLDEVEGVLFAKDLLHAVLDDEEPVGGWRTLVRPAWFIPITNTVDAQLRDFRVNHRHIALVVDEFGGIAGLVTLEDVLEVIVGDIRDENDAEDDDQIKREGRDKFWIPAHVSLDTLSALTSHDFHHEDVTTVGGLAYELFDGVPEPGEDLEVQGFRVVIEQMRGRRIERVYFERLPETSAGVDE